MTSLKKLQNISLIFFMMISLNTLSAQETDREFYQIKIYSFASQDQVDNADNFFENAYLPALKKQGIESVGVFKPREMAPGDTLQKVYVLLPFTSLDQIAGLQAKLDTDAQFQSAGKDFITASYENPPYARIQSIILKAFEKMPQLKPSAVTGTREDRVYELRSYQSPTVAYHQNKVKMFNDGGEVALFKKLNFNAVFYGEVISGPDMPNLMYMTTFTDQKSRDEHWKSFSDAPEWKKLSALPEYQNNVSHIDITFLHPTSYSDY